MYLNTGEAPVAGGELSRWRDRLKRALLLALMGLLTLNLFTGSPLLSLWLGSRVQGDGPPTMEAFFTFAAALAAGSFGLVKLLSAASRAHDALIGRRPTIRRHLPWLRSMRGERPHEAGDGAGLSALEVMLVIAVFVVVAAFEIWFFFYSTSPIDQRTGRD